MATDDNRFILPTVQGSKTVEVQQHRSGSVAAQFLYKNGDNYVMMDTDTYDLIEIEKAWLGPLSGYLKEGLDGITITFSAGFMLGLEIPAIVELEVVELICGIDSTTGEAITIAVLETSAKVTVPPTIRKGQIIRVDTKNGMFAGLAEIK